MPFGREALSRFARSAPRLISISAVRFTSLRQGASPEHGFALPPSGSATRRAARSPHRGHDHPSRPGVHKGHPLDEGTGQAGSGRIGPLGDSIFGDGVTNKREGAVAKEWARSPHLRFVWDEDSSEELKRFPSVEAMYAAEAAKAKARAGAGAGAEGESQGPQPPAADPADLEGG